ncbi:cytoskeleton protein RodZ [Proteus terrae]|uniref:cytoskeleton protein RodZ n=1 Tax=Proteus terrae TaxID=1574161 RepID=UPI000BFB622D|nr:cytoskeleton protein RodZ [Proteus terrae]ATM99969.1 cytoskeleton protein RodZ [Proteus vulgaris]MBJ2108445.1 cytoskeleton protein RodZ [Proteus terrae]MBJ2131240.1 cytoskeleton protein RodZ [Proteus terrae]
MNTENKTEEVKLTAGQLLRQAREKVGLTQQTVADRLCLKLSTVRDIETDTVSSDIAPTFLRGYMRSYAKLVGVPEKDILGFIDQQAPVKQIRMTTTQNYSLGKRHKKREGWLMKLTWVILIIMVAFVGVWWWQGHQADQQELVSMASQDIGQNSTQENTNTIDSPLATTLDNTSTSEGDNLQVPASPLVDNQANNVVISPTTETTSPASTEVRTVPLPVSPLTTSTTSRANSAQEATSSEATAIANQLVLMFDGECWLEIRNAQNKVLFNGIKKAGDRLEFDGEQPYKLKIGAPSVTRLQFNGESVDLSRFTGKIAKITVPSA